VEIVVATAADAVHGQAVEVDAHVVVATAAAEDMAVVTVVVVTRIGLRN
jgi:hypothetical protein